MDVGRVRGCHVSSKYGELSWTNAEYRDRISASGEGAGAPPCHRPQHSRYAKLEPHGHIDGWKSVFVIFGANTLAEFTILHNPRCSKSREALALLQAKGIDPSIVEYLKTPPSASQLKAIVKQLGIKPEQLVRKNEEIYKSRYANKTLSDAQWIEAMVENPSLIERPIVIRGQRAALGRPPQNVLQLLE